MNIQVPAQFHRETMYSLISTVIGDDFAPKYSKIIFDFNALRFIKPAGVTVLSNLIQWLIKIIVLNKTLTRWLLLIIQHIFV